MARSLGSMKESVNTRIRDKSGGTVTDSDLTEFFRTAASELQVRTEYPGTKLSTNLELFGSIQEYPIPDTFKTYIDLRTPIRTEGQQEFDFVTSKEFTALISPNPSRKLLAINNDLENDYLRINIATTAITGIDVVGEGGANWEAVTGTGADDIVERKDNRFEDRSAYIFSIDPAIDPNEATLEATIPAVDLSNNEYVGSAFVNFYAQNLTGIESLTLRLGSDSSNYIEMTADRRFHLEEFGVGKNVVRFKFVDAVENGTPDLEEVEYASLTVNYSAELNTKTGGFAFNLLRSGNPTIAQFDYYSDAFAKGATGEYKNNFTADTDISLFTDFEDQMLIHHASANAFKIMREYADAQIEEAKYEELFRRITNKKPSEATRQSASYYKFG